jgi:nucleoid-associated protein YgaU
MFTQEELNKNMGLWACRKTWTVKSGDRLDIIANIELKDASLWRKIAQENHIDDPLNFPTNDDIGRKIIIPD